ncbi:phosphatidylinositol-glycan biosynthesis class F protein [Adelges cooleyi]|uniref:phosphatidylinositol-glycan biosynthesis class F protein n=1 Tax=Adelges cooleyi TaxID=133065 RepID=UPI002180373D|nr:phosphatidylinositol-glycan biosynthesis class F protein [Adelges cooleyi]
MAKKNIRSILKKPDSASFLVNTYDSSEYKPTDEYIEVEANKDPELIPYCCSSFCYLGVFIWLLLDKNYNLLLDRNCLYIIATCYVIEFFKYTCYCYLVSRLPHHLKLKTNPIVWIFQFVISTILAIGLAYFFSVLFGAPVFSKQEETLVFSILIASVIITPTAMQLGSNILPLLLTELPDTEYLSALEKSERNNFRGTVLGAFVGAIVVPFDWETEWQRWPIPCSLGLICGHLLVNVYDIICWQYKSIKKLSDKRV